MKDFLTSALFLHPTTKFSLPVLLPPLKDSLSRWFLGRAPGFGSRVHGKAKSNSASGV
jgi:hypothetical protein